MLSMDSCACLLPEASSRIARDSTAPRAQNPPVIIRLYPRPSVQSVVSIAFSVCRAPRAL